MSEITLREYQKDAVDDVGGCIAFGDEKIIVDSPPGSGKSYQMTALAEEHQHMGVIIVVSISALIEQLDESLKKFNCNHSVLKANYKGTPFDKNSNVQLVMAQTLQSRLKKGELEEWKNKFKIIMFDEFHNAGPITSNRARDIVSFINPQTIIGFSGSPYDYQGFKFPYYEYIYTRSIRDLTNEGHLTPIKTFVPVWAEKVDYSSVKVERGDYNADELEEIINTSEHLKLALKSMNDMNAKDKKTIVFCSSISQAELFGTILRNDGYKIAISHSKNGKEGDKAIDDFRVSKEPSVLISINRLSMGFDVPSIELGVMLRPTKSRALFLQQIMRLARLHDDKKYAEFLDLAQMTSTFGFYDEPYYPPERTGDKKVDMEAIREANKNSLEHLKAVLDGSEPKEISIDIYNAKLQEIKAKQREDIKKLSVKDLAAIFEVSDDHKEIITIATMFYMFKYGKPVSKKGFEYEYKPNWFWSAKINEEKPEWSIEHDMSWYFEQCPEKKHEWIKALKSRLRTIIKQELGLFRIQGFIKFLYEKYQEEKMYSSVYTEYNMDEDDQSDIPF